MVLLVSVAVAGVALLLFVGLFIFVDVLQAKHLSDLNKDIKTNTATLQAIPGLSNILTVQNQLNSLTSLHQQKPDAARLLDYLGQLTPANATISDAKADFTANTLTITGNADALSTVNQYVDTLKFTTYTSTSNTQAKAAFSKVVLTNFSKQLPQSSYQIDLQFDVAIFDNTQKVTLTTPHIISTRSEVDKPGDLFQADQSKRANP
jgi:predicted membrane-bound mannosyltransferase